MAELQLTFEGLRGGGGKLDLTVDKAEFSYDSPDDAHNKASVGNMTLTVSGELTDTNDDDTLELIKDWVSLEGQEKGAYCKVTLKVIGAEGRVHREFTFPDAFVVDYKENYSTKELIYAFKIRQRKDKLKNIDFGQENE